MAPKRIRSNNKVTERVNKIPRPQPMQCDIDFCGGPGKTVPKMSGTSFVYVIIDTRASTYTWLPVQSCDSPTQLTLSATQSFSTVKYRVFFLLLSGRCVERRRWGRQCELLR